MMLPPDAGSDSSRKARSWTQVVHNLDSSDIPALVGKGLLVAVVLEILLGGNGYLTKLAGFRIREILFALCMLWVPFRLFVYRPIRLPWPIWALMAFFLGTTVLGIAVGYSGGSRPGAILAELKPLSYFFMLPFFAVTIRDRADVLLIAKLIVVCGVILAVAHLSVLAVAYAGLIEYAQIYRFLTSSAEFIFRHDPRGPFVGFLYKGHFHVGVAMIFLMVDPRMSRRVMASLLAVSVALTLTRGFAVSVVVSVLIGALVNPRATRILTSVLQIALLVGVLAVAFEVETRMTWSETVGANVLVRPTDSIRLNDVAAFLAQDHDPVSIAIGRGLGSLIGVRERIEMTYLELFAKQGLLGLALWGSLFAYVAFLYFTLSASLKKTGLPFLLATVYVFVATSTNTFLTGSIGMAVVFISLTALSALKHSNPPRYSGAVDTSAGQPLIRQRP